MSVDQVVNRIVCWIHSGSAERGVVEKETGGQGRLNTRRGSGPLSRQGTELLSRCK